MLNDISNGISCSGEADEYLKKVPQWNVQGADGQLAALSKAHECFFFLTRWPVVNTHNSATQVSSYS